MNPSTDHNTPTPFVQVPVALIVDSSISDGEFRTLMAMKAHDLQSTGIVWPSQSRLALISQVTEKTIRNRQSILESKDLIAIEVGRAPSYGHSGRPGNRYELRINPYVRRIPAGELPEVRD